MSSSYFMHLWTAQWKSEGSTRKWVLYVGGIIYYVTAGTIKIFEISQKGTIIRNFKYCLQKSSVGLVSPGGSFCLAGCRELRQSSGKKGIFHPVAILWASHSQSWERREESPPKTSLRSSWENGELCWWGLEIREWHPFNLLYIKVYLNGIHTLGPGYTLMCN